MIYYTQGINWSAKFGIMPRLSIIFGTDTIMISFPSKTTVREKWLPAETVRMIWLPAENLGRKQTHADSLSRKPLTTDMGAPVAQWVKRRPTDLADRVRSPLEAKSSQL